MTEDTINIHIPDRSSAEQGQGEYFFLTVNGRTEKISFHDYDKIYSIPGLYEKLFYDRYKCNSPEVVCSLLEKNLEQADLASSDLSVLDIGAGNGIVGEVLKKIGAENIVGLDIIEEAEEAAWRDRPEVYQRYYTADLTRLTEKEQHELNNTYFNCMTVVAALGFEDIPPHAFSAGYNFIDSPGWFAFNIKEDFLENKTDSSGFSKLINEMMNDKLIDLKDKHLYRHRLCQDGTPLNYYAVVAEKKEDVPEDMVQHFL